MNRDPDEYELMPGRRVAEHLLAAEAASRRNETYDFPGGVLFPIKNFDFDNMDHFPFPYDIRFCWNAERLLRGYKVFQEMTFKWLDEITLKYMKFLEMPELVPELKFKLTPRNQRQPEHGESSTEVQISPDASDANDEPNPYANEAAMVNINNNEESVQPGQVTNQVTEEQVTTIANAATVAVPIDNQSVQPNVNVGEGAQEAADKQIEIDIDIDVDIDANPANQDIAVQGNENPAVAPAHVPNYNSAADFQAAFIDPNAVAPVRRPVVPRPRQPLPQQVMDDVFFQIEAPQIRNRRRNRRNRNRRPVHRAVSFQNDDDSQNLLDMFENQLDGHLGRPVEPTDFDLPIPDLPEDLWPHIVQPEAAVPNVDVGNAEAQNVALQQIDDQDIGNVENFEDFQQTKISEPSQQSSPARAAQSSPARAVQSSPARAAQHSSQLQPSGLSPILEVDIETHGDNANAIDPNAASTVGPVYLETTHNVESGTINSVSGIDPMETIGAQVAPDANEEQNEMPANGSIEIGQQDPVPAGNQPVVNDLEARRQLIRLELVRWRRQFVRGNNPSNRHPPRPIPLRNYNPEDFAVRREPNGNMVHPRLALEDMTEVYRIIQEFLSRLDGDTVPIEEYLERFPVGEKFKALIGLADAVEENSLLIDIDENNHITGFRRVPDEQ